MKAASIVRLSIGVFIISFLVSFITLPPLPVQAQESGYTEPSEKYSREELAQMLAPIALYPDALLSQVLMASTYPIEVIEADRWIRKNPDLKGDALDDALLDQDWDPSVKAVCHFPTVLALMSERISETTNIGNAFLAQEDDVMGMVQELRAKAYAGGKLASNSEQKVIVEKKMIIIEPVDPRIIYVPYYDPLYVYDPWWYPAYPPYYWGPPRVRVSVGISYWPGIYFSFIFGSWGYFDWHHHYIYINVNKRPRYVRHNRWTSKSGRWNHAPRHRRGVAYRDKTTARTYGQYPRRTRDFSPDVRGFPEKREPARRIEDRTRIERNKLMRTGTAPERQERQRVEREQQERVRIESQKQKQQQIELQRREREKLESQRQQQRRIERQQQERIRVEPQRQKPQRVESRQQERTRDTVFNRVEEGRTERESSRRGRTSRQREETKDRGRRDGRGRGMR